ncbi:MAG: corrinoid protein [Candidatus Bathyarchaeia archaeon]
MSKESIFEELKKAILSYDVEASKSAAKRAIQNGISPLEAIEKGLMVGIREVGEKFEKMEIFLPHLIMAADAMQAGIEVLKSAMSREQLEEAKVATYVLGTIQGDIHSIGKDLVGYMLKCSGFDVIDLGVDVPIDRFIETAKNSDAQLIGVSALMSSTQKLQKDLVDFLKAIGLRDRFKVMVGGAGVTEEWFMQTGADGYGKDAMEAVKMAKELIGMKK